jgi:heterotetrameric sarcosine oxidase gamma subunit
MSTRTEGGCVSDLGQIPLARGPIAPVPPVTVWHGWEVSGRRASGALTLTDCAPLAKLQAKAPVGGRLAAELGIRFGRSARNDEGVLVVGSGPGEWLLIGPAGEGTAIAALLEGKAAASSDELMTVVDITHGRALMRLNGSCGAAVLAQLCGVEFADDITPDGAALRSSVAAVATDIVRDDRAGVCSYLLHCERSSGQYLFDKVLESGAPYGIEIAGFIPPGI